MVNAHASGAKMATNGVGGDGDDEDDDDDYDFYFSLYAQRAGPVSLPQTAAPHQACANGANAKHCIWVGGRSIHPATIGTRRKLVGPCTR